MRFIKVIVLLLMLLIILAACSTQEVKTFEFNGTEYVLPDYAFNPHHPGAPKAYAIATAAMGTEVEEIMQHIPCYCECGDDPFNHTDILSCFIDLDRSTASTIEYDSHGAT